LKALILAKDLFFTHFVYEINLNLIVRKVCVRTSYAVRLDVADGVSKSLLSSNSVPIGYNANKVEVIFLRPQSALCQCLSAGVLFMMIWQ
jgi:hypothetical protein